MPGSHFSVDHPRRANAKHSCKYGLMGYGQLIRRCQANVPTAVKYRSVPAELQERLDLCEDHGHFTRPDVDNEDE